MQQQLYELLCDFCFYYPGPAYAFKLNGLLSISIPLSIFIFFIVRVIEKTIDFSLHFDSLLCMSWNYLVWNNFLKSKLFKGSEDRMKWNRFRIDFHDIIKVRLIMSWIMSTIFVLNLFVVFLLKWNNGKQWVFVTRNVIWNAWMLYEFLLHEIIENN